MIKLNTYINFKNNQCLEAMEFYQNILGGNLNVMSVKGSPMEDAFPDGIDILHADLTGDDFTIQGTDIANPDVEATNGIVSITLNCPNLEDMRNKFARLSEGGKTVHPIMTFFAGSMGNVVDKYGVRWGIFTEEKNRK
ncbi:VOC family protein [Mucilaginibacter sp.]|uniref:VOC family protein n=1 Tax=Mucilaginibacter sp. TaxID=1882438 RepID=UPI000CB34577|nr:VOC family protein [Mucilaginibacter sp.]PLW89800.1 MAG: hypothetical protein C0154_09650 [Mucilaginibacter sp.]HEK18913.1 VOC family protein [Bacteroidota bacterium]